MGEGLDVKEDTNRMYCMRMRGPRLVRAECLIRRALSGLAKHPRHGGKLMMSGLAKYPLVGGQGDDDSLMVTTSNPELSPPG